MERFARRAIVLQGRRSSTVDPALAARATPRAKASRAVRVALRQGRGVFLRTTRWDAVSWWLDDLASDLGAGTPSFSVARLDLSTVGKDEGVWSRVPDRLADLLNVPPRPGPPVTTREGFVARVRDLLLVASKTAPPRVLVLEDADRVGATMSGDLVTAWREVRRRVPVARMPRIVVTARWGGVPLDTKHGVERLLPDPTEAEAVVMLAELLGPGDPERLRWIVEAVGPVPAFLVRLAKAGGPFDAGGVRAALGSTHEEIRTVVQAALAQDTAAERLAELITGPKTEVERVDRVLTRTGLIASAAGTTWLRSPLFVDALREA